MKSRLRREIQCEKCPWRKSTNPNKIPNGYSVKKHRALKSTIADPDAISFGVVRVMACHESDDGGDGEYCVGWLMNQLGPGNNIGLRMKMLKYDLSHIRTVGRQHERFEQTIPRGKP